MSTDAEGAIVSAPGGRRWLRAALIAAAVYAVSGVAFGIFAGEAASDDMRRFWRLAAWVVSAVAYGAQIGYEHFRLRSSARTLALHASAATAVGAFALAAWANLHSHLRGPVMLKVSLVLWPVLTAVPAFVVALVAAMALSWLRRDS